MNATLRNFALWVIIILLLMALLTLFQNPGIRTDATDIAFSRFPSEVDQGRVRDVLNQGPEIHGTFTDGRKFMSFAPNETSWMQRLYGKGVSITVPAAERRAVVRVTAGLLAPVHRTHRRLDFPVAANARDTHGQSRRQQVVDQRDR
jgi:hypothetical protein